MKRGVLVDNATKQFGDLRVMEGLNVQFFEGEVQVASRFLCHILWRRVPLGEHLF